MEPEPSEEQLPEEDLIQEEDVHGLLADKDFGTAQLFTVEYAFVLVYMGVHMTRSNLFLGILTPFFESIGGVSDSTDNMVQVATFMVPAGALFTPLVEIIISKARGSGGALLVHVLGACYGSLMFVQSPLWVQLITTALYGFYRALLFSVIAAFNVEVFGLASTGRINGVMYSVTGFLSLIITPALDYVQDSCDGDFKWLLVYQFLAMIPSLALTIVLYFYSKEPFVGGPRMVRIEPEEGSEEDHQHVRLIRSASKDVAKQVAAKKRAKRNWTKVRAFSRLAGLAHSKK